MTVQVPETLRYKGEVLTFDDYPLEPYLESGRCRVKFQATSTALHRGYAGTWAIEHARLYLIKLEGHVGEFANTVEVGLEMLFPDSPDGVFARWFSGQICCPMGELLNYGRGGFTSVYESDLFIQIEQGVVVSEQVVMNGEASTPVQVRAAPTKNAEDKFLNLFRKKTD